MSAAIATLESRQESFPYKREFINPGELWDNCVSLDVSPLKVIHVDKINDDRPSGWRSIPREIRWEFQGKLIAFVVRDEAYNQVNRLTDYFSEVARMKSHRKGHLSPYQFFSTNYDLIEKKARELAIKDTQSQPFRHWLREAVYELIPECTTFKISVTKSLFSYLKSKIVLDPSAGWGDRLLGAAAAGVDVYHGIDPNTEMRSCYDEMIRFVQKQDSYSVITDDFLKVNLQPESYDTVFTSPPFFDYEIYSSDAKQSINGRGTLDAWKTDFFLPYLKKAWEALAKNGYFTIYISDTKTGKYVHDMLRYINQTLNGTFLGVIGVTNPGYEYAFPIWVWRK
jgi:16S rRNA G966 N2-methylase RsmD